MICIDNTPINPDEMIIQCSNAKCRKWLHVNCIAEQAVKEYEKGTSIDMAPLIPADDITANGPKKAANTPKKRGRPKNVKINPETKASGLATNKQGTVSAEVFIKGVPDGPNDTPSASSEVVLIDSDGQEHAEDLLCLHCSETIMDD